MLNLFIFQYLNNSAASSDFFAQVVIFFATEFGWFLIGGLLVYLFMHKDKTKGVRDVTVVISAAILAWIAAESIKLSFPEPRPFSILQNAHALIRPEDLQTFPSGHATFFSALAVALYFYHRRLGVLYALSAFLIGIARIAAGVHWPLDILVGYILGGFIGIAVYYGYQQWVFVR
jgi:undecaprenyl-diphosphatase